jgi:putative ABC transport system permease protein
MVYLSYTDLVFASLFLVAAGILSFFLKLNTEKALAVAASRMVIQLLLLGLILKTIFTFVNIWVFFLMAGVMVFAAGFEILSRQKYRFKGIETFLIGTGTMGMITFTISFITLFFIITKKPWYTPQYAIPLLGMMLGNTMNGISIGLDRLSGTIVDQKRVIEARLMLGETAAQAVTGIRKDSIKSGMIPLINSMSAAGLVTLPGMMTGQILAGAPPVEAVKYQILIMFLIAACSALGTICAVTFASKRFFDSRDRLRLERLK